MGRAFKYLLASTLASTSALGAVAQTSSRAELEARIDALEAAIAELRVELDADQEEILRIEQMAETNAEEIVSVNALTIPRATGFRVGDTTISLGGFIDLDTHLTYLSEGSIDSGSIARDIFIPGATPVGGESTTIADFTAQSSRFFLSGARDVGGKQLTGYIELDFLGSLQGNDRVTSSFAPRLRRAYVDYNNRWRLGQEWSTFQNTSAIPESASFLVLSDGQVFVRQPIIRYTRGNFQFALENGDTTITDPFGGGSIEADANFIPDLIARYNLRGEFGNVSFSAIGRQLRLEGEGEQEQAFGYGFNVAGRLNVGERDDIRFNLVGGEGVGRYVGLNAIDGAALDPETGELEAIPVYGAMVAYRHPFNDSVRINLGWSGLFAENPDFVPGAETQWIQSAYSALLWDVVPRFTVGAEVLVGRRRLENDDEGDIARFTFSTRYSF